MVNHIISPSFCYGVLYWKNCDVNAPSASLPLSYLISKILPFGGANMPGEAASSVLDKVERMIRVPPRLVLRLPKTVLIQFNSGKSLVLR